MKLTIEDIENVQRQIDELKSKLEVDKFKDLKKAFSEGAIIEAKQSYNEWYEDCEPKWYFDAKYRIKGNISIDRWNAHKDVIKLWWDGAEIESEWQNGKGYGEIKNPRWYTVTKYRIKPTTWKLPEYEDGAEWISTASYTIPQEMRGEYFTKIGRRRSSRQLAERCAKASKERDLCEAYRDNIEPNYRDTNICELAYYIYIDKDGDYHVAYNDGIRSIGTVYGSHYTMEQIATALTNKEISWN